MEESDKKSWTLLQRIDTIAWLDAEPPGENLTLGAASAATTNPPPGPGRVPRHSGWPAGARECDDCLPASESPLGARAAMQRRVWISLRSQIRRGSAALPEDPLNASTV